MFDFIQMLPDMGRFFAFTVAFWAVILLNGAYVGVIVTAIDRYLGGKKIPEWRVKEAVHYQEEYLVWGWASTSEWSEESVNSWQVQEGNPSDVWEEPLVREEYDTRVVQAPEIELSWECDRLILAARRARGEAFMVSRRVEALLAA